MRVWGKEMGAYGAKNRCMDLETASCWVCG